jgi:hypothetical protein
MGTPMSDGFMKRYELHYQLKKVEVDGAVLNAQFGCVNFHTMPYKRSGVRLMIAMKNGLPAGRGPGFTVKSRCISVLREGKASMSCAHI